MELNYSDWTVLDNVKLPTRVPSGKGVVLGEDFFVFKRRNDRISGYSLNINSLRWTDHQSLPNCDGPAVTIDDHQVVLVDSQNPRIYNFLTKRCTPLPELNTEPHNSACVIDGTRIYTMRQSIGGGEFPGMKVLDLSAPSDLRSWTIISAKMRTPRNHYAVAAENGKIYVVGGCDQSGTPLNTCEVFDVREKKWNNRTVLPRMKQCRSRHSMVVRDDKLIVIGGYDGYKALDTVEFLDLNDSLSSWCLLDQRLNQGRSDFVAATTRTGIIVAGGYERDHSESYIHYVTVEMLRLAPESVPVPPQLPPIPRGFMDAAHKTALERWKQEVTEHKESYESSITVDISDHQASCARQREHIGRRIQDFQRQIEQIEVETEQKVTALREALEAWNQSTAIDVKGVEDLLRMITLFRGNNDDERRPGDPFSPVSYVSPFVSRDSPPGLFVCPITQDLMDDPVIAADGHTYERSAIEDAIRTKPVSPVTRQFLRSTSLYSNLGLRSQIMQWKHMSHGTS